MSSEVITSNYSFQSLMKGQINASSDLFTVCLMRSGFIFNRDIHGQRKNVKGSKTGAGNITWSASAKTATLAGGGFTSAGFVAGNKCQISGTTLNNGTKTILTATDTVLTFTEDCSNESNTSAVITADDELASGYGYTQESKQFTGYSGTLDETNDWFKAAFSTTSWTPTGGNIGPSPGAIVYDYTDTDKTLMFYVDFGGEQTFPAGVDLALANPSMTMKVGT
jgi:hypothetical protein